MWDLARRPQPWTAGLPALQRSFALEDVSDEQRAADVGAIVLVQCLSDVDETRELLRLAAREPAVAGVVGWLDLAAASFAADLRALRCEPGGSYLVGLRHQLQEEPDPDWLDRPRVRDSLRRLGEARLAYDVVVSVDRLPQVGAAVAELPDVRFVLDHAGNPPIAGGGLERWREDLTALAEHPNVAVKLSGLVTNADWERWTVDDVLPVADHVLRTFGAERTMFGSDWPVCLLAARYGDVVAVVERACAALAADGARRVWADTARAWYGLP